jgi:hypothetical protein
MIGVRGKLTRLAAAAALGLGLVALPVAVPNAQAASPCILSVTQVIGYSQYRVEVGCGNLGSVVSFKVYGSDTFDDDYQFTISWSWGNVPKPWCNEDIADRDELYAKVTYRTASGATGTSTTDILYGWF